MLLNPFKCLWILGSPACARRLSGSYLRCCVFQPSASLCCPGRSEGVRHGRTVEPLNGTTEEAFPVACAVAGGGKRTAPFTTVVPKGSGGSAHPGAACGSASRFGRQLG